MTQKQTPYTATHIANYFIANLSYVDNIRLNKLAYISYGYYSAFYDDGELFYEIIQAWKLGPVIPSIYHDFKHYGNAQIKHLSYFFYSSDDDQKTIPIVDKSDDKTKKILDAVIGVYGNMSASDLINRTHKEGTPWQQAYKENAFDIEIDKMKIKEYYKKLLKENV